MPRALAALARSRASREAAVFLGFCLLAAVMTWPWAANMEDAVADAGDPYMIAWALWWDYHQTFTDPLNLFHANVFYPYRYTLAFSEHDYGVSLLLFPLFAAGARPLTVHSVATFLGFAFCGYGAFRLARTLTGSRGAAWVAGFVYAFIPFRFEALGHLHYLFAGWMPLLLEALVLFARGRSRRRAAWLGAAFVMNALTCVTWMILTLAPLALTGLLVLARDPALRRERDFWLRGGVAAPEALGGVGRGDARRPQALSGSAAAAAGAGGAVAVAARRGRARCRRRLARLSVARRCAGRRTSMDGLGLPRVARCELLPQPPHV